MAERENKPRKDKKRNRLATTLSVRVNWRNFNESRRHHRDRMVGWGAAFGAVAIPLALFLAKLEPSSEAPHVEISHDLPDLEASYTVATSDKSFPKTARLSDRSAVTLETGRTALRVGFTSTTRDVQLLEGRATFKVADDPKRPFVVNTHLARVVAGANRPTFVVDVDSRGMNVQVYEGEVEILHRISTGPGLKLREGDPAYRVPMEDVGAMAANRMTSLAVVLPRG
jgi:ferric-dicitrate binding protein FerR (iron transport regulator)